MTYLFSNSINLQLPLQPETTDPEQFKELLILYNAIRQLHAALDGFFDIPPKQFTAAHTLDITDRGHSIDTTANVTIPKDDNVPWNLGATVMVTNLSNGNISIIPAAGVTLVVAGTATSGTRTLAKYGMATLRYVGNNIWLIIGAGVS